MKHLTIDEIIEFVSIDELNNESLDLAGRVNAHIMNCDECLRRVRAFQTIYDEYMRLKKEQSFDEYVKKREAEIEIIKIRQAIAAYKRTRRGATSYAKPNDRVRSGVFARRAIKKKDINK